MSVALDHARTSGVRVETKLGRYQLVATLGQGGMGTIHLAVAGGLPDFRKLSVVKELRQDLSANRRFVEMFLDEAKLAARLNHPNVVQTIEAGQEGDRYFLSMEFLDGQPFSAIMQAAEKSPKISLPLRLKVLCDALAGLQYAHTLTEYDGTQLHIVHRDVSPQNIFVTYDGQVKVVDFGIAKAAVSSTLTSPGMFKGKFAYAAPEQVRGIEVDARTDVFAMGVILWETLTMKRFSDGVVSRAAVAARLGGEEPRVDQVDPMVDEQLALICNRALAVDPDDRFASAEEFRSALERYLVESDQRVESSALQQVLAQKFAAERREVHRLIDRHIKHGAVEESHVTAVALGTEAGNNQPTQVADLSKYVRNTTTETVVSGVVEDFARDNTRSRTRSMMLLMGAGPAFALALGLVLGVMHSNSPESPTPAPHPLPPVAASAALPAQPIAAHVEPPAAAQAPAPAAAAPAERVEAKAAAEQPEAPEEAEPAQQARPDAARVQRRPLPRRRAFQPGASEPPTPAEETAAVRSEPVAPAAPAAVGVGSDLNRLGRSDNHRVIDNEM